MKPHFCTQHRFVPVCVTALAIGLSLQAGARAADPLAQIKERGVLRHLGIPYANFVTGMGDGMDVELAKMFAAHLGVRYEYVPSSWDTVISDLSGKVVKVVDGKVEIVSECKPKGDMVASGLTILPWRKEVVDFSEPTFPTQVWLLAPSESGVKPIKPSGRLETDIIAVKKLMTGHTVLGKLKCCLDPSLYKLSETGANIRLFDGNLNELAPAIIQGEAELTLLDVADVLIALRKWPGRIKVIGPICQPQEMGCAFAKDAGELRAEFNRFLNRCYRDGTYERLLRKYYPAIVNYYPRFFAGKVAPSSTQPGDRITAQE